jgi:hypothetical protein
MLESKGIADLAFGEADADTQVWAYESLMLYMDALQDMITCAVELPKATAVHYDLFRTAMMSSQLALDHSIVQARKQGFDPQLDGMGNL